jgi:cell division transport system ATP-binding protein
MVGRSFVTTSERSFDTMISLSNVTFRHPNSRTESIAGFNLRVEKGEFAVLHGASGSGKTTVFNLLIAALKPDSGEIVVGPHEWGEGKRLNRPALRRSLGMVFEDFKLLDERTVAENIALPLELNKKLSALTIREEVRKTVERFGLKEIANQLPRELSMGERQRASIARAVITEPLVLLLDEPTAQLDFLAAREILDHLKREHLRGMTILLGTSDERIADLLPEARKIGLEDKIAYR